MSWLLRQTTYTVDSTHSGSIYEDGSPCYTIRMHHRGKFVGGDDRIYVGVAVNHFDCCDSDYMSLTKLNEMTKHLGYVGGTMTYFCMVPSVGWKCILTDMDAVDLGKWVNINNVVDLYVDHCEGGETGLGQGCSSQVKREGTSIVIAESDDDIEFVDNIEGELPLPSCHEVGEKLDECAVVDDEQLYDSVGFGVVGSGHAPTDLPLVGDHSRQNEETEGSADLNPNDDEISDYMLDRIIGSNVVMAAVGGDPDNVVSDSDVSVDDEEAQGECIPSGSRQKRKSAPRYPQFNAENDMENPQFSIGLEFDSVEAFKMAVIEASVKDGREVRWKKNDKNRIRAGCVGDCDFVLFASRKNMEHTLQVKTYKPHTCNRSFNVPLAKKKWLLEKYRDRLRSNPKYPVNSLKADIMREHTINVSRATLYRVRSGAMKEMLGSEPAQYKLLWSYGSKLCRSNSGTTFLIKAKPLQGNQAQFQRIYICLGALKKGFLEGCRLFIGLDGCFLKGPTGILLTAVGVDANGQIYPFAYAVVENENYKSWRWFVENIIEDMGIVNDTSWTFISDKQKGLQRAIEELMPNAEHRHCLRHMYNNFRMKFKGLCLKNLLFESGKATRECDFNKAMARLKVVDTEAHDWLFARPPRYWSRAFFNTDCKCDHLLNNLCESFNGIEQIIDARSLPILHMLEKIRVYLMERIHKQRQAMKRYTGDVCPSVQQQLEKIKKDSAAYIPVWSGAYKFEVTDGHLRSRVVDLQAKTCSCRTWDLSGIPCSHAVAACNFLRLSPEDFVDEKLKKPAFMKTYDYLLNPISDKDLWPETGLHELLPPEVTKMPGRPKANRRNELGEIETSQQGSHKLRRVGTRVRCGFCGLPGHNKRGCVRLKESRGNTVAGGTTTSSSSLTMVNVVQQMAPNMLASECNDPPRVLTQDSHCETSQPLSSGRPPYGQPPQANEAQTQQATLQSVRIRSYEVQTSRLGRHGTPITTLSHIRNALSQSDSSRPK